jgi:F-type H+-transporting ATPase subunit delta
VTGFATFVLEALSVDQLEEVEDDLFRFARIVQSTPALRAALTDRDLPLEVRRGVVRQLLEGKAQAATVRLVDYVLVGGRARDTVGTLDWLVEQTARARGWRVARVRAAADVEQPERDRLTTTLSRIAGTAVELQVTVDPALLAGVVVQVGDLQVDSSVISRLNELREHLLLAGWERPDLSNDEEESR